MVQAVINIDEHVNRVLNVVKAKYGLRDKSQAIGFVVSEYERSFLEPALRPEYVEKAGKIMSEGGLKSFSSVGDLRKSVEDARV
jgi:hypothetical protein